MSAETPSRREPVDIDQPPPFLRSWRNVYLLLLGEIALLVIGFAVLRSWAS